MAKDAKPPRRNRSPADLRQELADQVALLVNACRSFDQGLRPVGKHIALSLRLLLHNSSSSKALLSQLDLVSKRFMDTSREMGSITLSTECSLCIIRMGGPEGGVSWEARSLTGEASPPRWIQFQDWWNNAVIKDEKGRTFNRRELILHVAETDGGAHVDPGLDEAYMALSRENSLGTEFIANGVVLPPENPALPCMRQIAHEVLETLKRRGVMFEYQFTAKS